MDFKVEKRRQSFFSAVRANSHGNFGFPGGWCRTNVAITRAKAGLIVIGHEQTLRHDKRSWGPFLDWAYAQGVVMNKPRVGTYEGEMRERTKALADGRKDFLTQQKEQQRDRLGLPTRTNQVRPTTAAVTRAPGISMVAKTPVPAPASVMQPTRQLRSKFASAGDPTKHIPPLKLGEVVTVISEDRSGWMRIMTSLGKEGYVGKDWMESIPKAPEVSAVPPSEPSTLRSVGDKESAKQSTLRVTHAQPAAV